MITKKDFEKLAAENKKMLGAHRDTTTPTLEEEALLRGQLIALRRTAEIVETMNPRANLRAYLEASRYFTAMVVLREWRAWLGLPPVYWRLLKDGLQLQP